MDLNSGDRIGPYTIDRELGRGGMGVVYLGHDTRLDRKVAIKALPEHFAADPDRLARFEREAKTLASLNHTNVAQIYGVEEDGGASYLVLELVEGETLADRLARGELPIDEALLICAGVASGVEAAHEAGVIHRDLKPANIKITPAGGIKVLDFGLAKGGGSTDASSLGSSTIRTMSTPHGTVTAAGQVFGTPSYMSPEQARGKTLDRRTDIWSFGVVLYECLAGIRPFDGETATDSIAAILERDPDLSLISQRTPPAVRSLLRHCLEKDSTRRLRDIGDARLLLEDAVATRAWTTTAIQAAQGQIATHSRRRGLLWAASVVVAAAAAAGAMFYLSPESHSPRPVHLEIRRGTDEPRVRFSGGDFNISPDGSMLVFSAGASGDSSQLYVRRLDQFQATPLSGTTGAVQPFFSPDGRWIGFFANGALKKIAVTGGAPLTLCEARGVHRGASWGDDGMIAFTPDTTTGIWLVSSNGGAARQLTTLDSEANERSHRWPHMLPGSDAVLFTSQVRGSDFDDATIEVVTIETGERKVLHYGGSSPWYTQSGHLVYGRAATLFASPFDPVALEVLAPAAPVLEGVATDPPTGGVEYAISQTGALLFGSGDSQSMNAILQWSDREGNRTQIGDSSYLASAAALSPDGTRIAMQIYTEGSGDDIWVYEIDRAALSRLTFDATDESFPIWSPDGEQIAYAGSTESEMQVFVVRADGSDAPRQITSAPHTPHIPISWSSDGAYIAVNVESQTTSWDLYTVAIDDDGAEPEVFLATQFEEYFHTFSPDGKWIAYSSDETGRREVYVRSFPRGGGRWQVSIDGGDWPTWSPDGSELLFNHDGMMYSAAIAGENETFRADPPQRLFPHSLPNVEYYPLYAVAPDGERILLLSRIGVNDGTDDATLSLILNWFVDLKDRTRTSH
jgi:serine/threonine-protein kinase